MKWTTRSHLHLDRTASAWLLRGFVDRDAEFEFLEWGRAPGAPDPRSFGMPGVRFSSYDENGTCFAKILEAYRLSTNSALAAMEAGIASGVRSALGIPRPALETAAAAALGSALDLIGTGLGLIHADDNEHLAAATPLYDALYQALRAADLDLADAPAGRPAQLGFIRAGLEIPAPTSI